MAASCPTIITPMYLGQPGSMQNLGTPDAGYQIIGGRGEATHVAISGATSVTRVPKMKRAWAINWGGLTDDTANLLDAFYLGAMGLGPYALVDPSWRNKLGDDVSSMGAKLQAISGWAASVGALAFDTSVAAQSPGSGVMKWTGAGSGSKLGIGTWGGGLCVPRTGEAPVYLKDQPTAGRIYARTATSTASLTLNADGLDASGTVQLAGSTSTVTLSSSAWTPLVSFLASGNASALYALPIITCNTVSAPVIQLCCADIQYGPTTLATLPAWAIGLGSPRVVFGAAGSGGMPFTVNKLPYRDQQFGLVES